MRRYINRGVPSTPVKQAPKPPTKKQLLKQECLAKKKFRKSLNKSRKPNVKRRVFVIDYYAQVLEDNLPASEKWFRDMYLKEDIKHTFSEDLFKDQFNKPFNKKYIPDICNMGYKYIIEIDGSIHNTPEQKFKDMQKDYYFEKRGYLVIRVKYGDNAGYKACIEKVKARRAEIDLIESAWRDRSNK